jgi:hypothetical protein
MSTGYHQLGPLQAHRLPAAFRKTESSNGAERVHNANTINAIKAGLKGVRISGCQNNVTLL